jgi:type II secretory pathway pseudopilin PulG
MAAGRRPRFVVSPPVGHPFRVLGPTRSAAVETARQALLEARRRHQRPTDRAILEAGPEHPQAPRAGAVECADFRRPPRAALSRPARLALPRLRLTLR